MLLEDAVRSWYLHCLGPKERQNSRSWEHMAEEAAYSWQPGSREIQSKPQVPDVLLCLGSVWVPSHILDSVPHI